MAQPLNENGPWVREQTVRNLVHLGLPPDQDVPLRGYVRELEEGIIVKEAALHQMVLFLEYLPGERDDS